MKTILTEKELNLIREIRQDIIKLDNETSAGILFRNFLCYELLNIVRLDPKIQFGYQVINDKYYHNSIWITVYDKSFHFNDSPIYRPGMKIYWTTDEPIHKKPLTLITNLITFDEERQSLQENVKQFLQNPEDIWKVYDDEKIISGRLNLITKYEKKSLIYDRILESIITSFVNKQKYAVCLLSSCLMDDICKMLNLDCTIVKGYITFPETNKYANHFWIEVKNKIYDSTQSIMKALHNQDITLEYHKKIPDGYISNDQTCEEEIQTVQELLMRYKSYIADSSKFWKESPKWVKKMRTNLRKKFK